MIVGHLPAGYLAAVGLGKAFPSRALFLGLIAGSVLPDLDILWFYLVDNRAIHHHGYLLHRPALWMLILLAGLVTKRTAAIGIGLGALLHMVLDTTLGQIAWGWPLSDAYTTFIRVQATHSHWVFSFMAHWTFKIELMLVTAALYLAFRRNRKRRDD